LYPEFDVMNLELFADDAPDPTAFDRRVRAGGYRLVAGVDEAGRGPLAGPVVAAAVILPEDVDLPGVDDSKKLSEVRREALYPLIRERALAVGVGVSSPEVIDGINILQATLAAMRQAVESLSPSPEFILVDGITQVPLPISQRTVKKGDSRSLSIAAASIVAKVTRDRLMVEYDRRYPGYGFASHKGYGSADHLAAIAALGPSPIHRITFRGVREHVKIEG
jgi:ribonuclease HII